MIESAGARLVRGFVAGLLALAISLPAAVADIPSGTVWTGPYLTRLDVGFPGGDFHARWDYERCACGDVLIRGEETLPGELRTGELLLVGGQALLVRGYPEEATGLALVDSPMLMLQLLLVLVQKAVPEGPDAVEGNQAVGLADEDRALLLDTGLAHGGFPAPWELQGQLLRADEGPIRFELDFQFSPGGASTSRNRSYIRLSGALDYSAREFPLGGDESLEGWSIFLLDEGGPRMAPEAVPGSLAELRALLESR